MEGMAANPLKVNEKIAFLCQRDGLGPSALARVAGVSPQAGSQYLTDVVPSAASLARITEHFKYSLRWFLNDELPVDQPVTDAAMLTDGELIAEMARRYRSEILRIADALDAVETMDTLKAAEAAFAAGIESEIERSLHTAVSASSILPMIVERYTIENWAYNNHDSLPGSDRNPDELLVAHLMDRARKLEDKNVGLLWIARFVELRNLWTMFPNRRAHYEAQLPKFLTRIKEGYAPDPLDGPTLVDQQTFSPQSGAIGIWRTDATRRREKMLKDGLNL